MLVATGVAIAGTVAGTAEAQLRAAGVVVAWAALGIALTLTFGDLDGLDAVAAALLAFGLPWAVAALLGAYAHSRRRADGDGALP